MALKVREELGELEGGGVILGIPRGGIVIGREISEVLGWPLRPIITKKIPVPENEELAIGALGEGGVVVWDEELCQRLGVSLKYREEILRKKEEELKRKERDFL